MEQQYIIELLLNKTQNQTINKKQPKPKAKSQSRILKFPSNILPRFPLYPSLNNIFEVAKAEHLKTQIKH